MSDKKDKLQDEARYSVAMEFLYATAAVAFARTLVMAAEILDPGVVLTQMSKTPTRDQFWADIAAVQRDNGLSPNDSPVDKRIEVATNYTRVLLQTAQDIGHNLERAQERHSPPVPGYVTPVKPSEYGAN